MLNLHCSNNDKKKQHKNPGYMSSKSTKVSTTLWRPMQFTDKNNQYMLKL